jgi:hypothetical protein
MVRFGTRRASLFYGSLETRTVLARPPTASFSGSMAKPPPAARHNTPVRRGISQLAGCGCRIHRSPNTAPRSSPSDYRASQALGTAMRAAGVEAFEFVSARDPEGGLNVALFTPKAFAKKEPVSQEAWLCELGGERARFRAARGRDLHDFAIFR